LTEKSEAQEILQEKSKSVQNFHFHSAKLKYHNSYSHFISCSTNQQKEQRKEENFNCIKSHQIKINRFLAFTPCHLGVFWYTLLSKKKKTWRFPMSLEDSLQKINFALEVF